MPCKTSGTILLGKGACQGAWPAAGRPLYARRPLRRFFPGGRGPRDAEGQGGRHVRDGHVRHRQPRRDHAACRRGIGAGRGRHGDRGEGEGRLCGGGGARPHRRGARPRLFRKDVDGAEQEPPFGAQAGKTRHVHHPGPHHPRGELQHHKRPRHDRHGEEEGYRHPQGHGRDEQEHHARLRGGRPDDRRLRRAPRHLRRLRPPGGADALRDRQAPERRLLHQHPAHEDRPPRCPPHRRRDHPALSLSTLYPSYKASRIDPVETLRYE